QYESAQAPAISGDWSRLITIAQRPSLHPQVPAAQLKVWSIDSLETLLADACQRLQPYLSRLGTEGDVSICGWTDPI
ncbi:MAG: hypothetical protein AAF766_24765, partial [Cyanobacteria bacterium P01_D01_bin.14]